MDLFDLDVWPSDHPQRKLNHECPWDNRQIKDLTHLLEGTIFDSENDVLQKIWDLGKEYNNYWPFEIFCPTEPYMMTQYLINLLLQTNKRPDDLFCDLGMGQGFPLMVMAAAGFRTYGVDNAIRSLKHVPKYARDVQDLLGIPFKHQPVIAYADLTAEDMPSFVFPDGTTMVNMDVFLCNVGDSRNYHNYIMMNLGPKKVGSIWLDYFTYWTRYHSSQKTKLLDTPYRPIFPGHWFSLLIAEQMYKQELLPFHMA